MRGIGGGEVVKQHELSRVHGVGHRLEGLLWGTFRSSCFFGCTKWRRCPVPYHPLDSWPPPLPFPCQYFPKSASLSLPIHGTEKGSGVVVRAWWGVQPSKLKPSSATLSHPHIPTSPLPFPAWCGPRQDLISHNWPGLPLKCQSGS